MEILIFIVLVVLTVYPLVKLLPAFGINPYWSATVIIMPFALIVLLWVMVSRLDQIRPRREREGA